MKFREFLLEEETLAELQKLDFVKFILALETYIEYNDKESADELYEFKGDLKRLGLIKPFKKLYRVIRLESTDKIEQRKITSASKKKYSGDFLEEVKDMIDQYKRNGDYYILELSGEGLDVNEFSKLFKGKKKELTKQYDTFGNEPMSILYDVFKQFSKQNEVIIFDKFEVLGKESV